MNSSGCCSKEREEGERSSEEVSGEHEMTEEIRAAEKVVNAFFYYKKYGRESVLGTISQLKQLSKEHQQLICEPHSAHITRVLQCIDANHEVLKQMVLYGVGMFGDELTKALRITQLRRPDPTYMSKVLSTLRQIVREWSSEGKADRDATFAPVMEELNERFPDVSTRSSVNLLLPGSGLGRLPWDLILQGFSVTGNEYSLFMLMISCFLLNNCSKTDEFTIYPFVFDVSNSWSYEDQTRPVSFPDECPATFNTQRTNSFAMCAGNFLEVTSGETDKWNGIVTAWFIDTANNIIDYIETIYRILKPGGVWINIGPLTYHFEGISDELSVELPYSEIIRIVREKGFVVEKERRIDSCYTVNNKSMLHNKYNCAFFVATKPL